MQIDLSKWGPATVLVVACVLIALVIGGIVTVVHPDTLTFAQYLDNLKTFAVAAGVLGVGRGILAGHQPVTDQAEFLTPPPADEDVHVTDAPPVQPSQTGLA